MQCSLLGINDATKIYIDQDMQTPQGQELCTVKTPNAWYTGNMKILNEETQLPALKSPRSILPSYFHNCNFN